MDLPARLEAWWGAFRSRSSLPAVAVGVSTPQLGRRVWCSGELDHEPVTGATVFYGASLTKQVVGALVARAVLGARVDPEAPVRSSLPGLPAWTAPVRVQHLLHHTAALPQPPALATALGYVDGMAAWWRLDNASVLRALSLVPPPSEPPGVRFAYDNTGYVLLAELLHAVEGRDLAELAQDVVLDPLGMTGSRVGGPPPVLLPHVDPPPRTTGDGGLWTCVDDLLVWLDALNGQQLGAALTALVQTPGRLTDGTVLDYAWGVGLQPGRVPPVYEHGGSWPGWGAKAVRCPTTSTAVALLAITDDVAALSAAALELHDLLASGRHRADRAAPAGRGHGPAPDADGPAGRRPRPRRARARRRRARAVPGIRLVPAPATPGARRWSSSAPARTRPSWRATRRSGSGARPAVQRPARGQCD